MHGWGKLTIGTVNAHVDETHAATRQIGPGNFALIAVSDTGMAKKVMRCACDPFFTGGADRPAVHRRYRARDGGLEAVA